MPLFQLRRAAVCAALLSLLCACSDPVGEGTVLTHFYLGTDVETTSAEIAECTSLQISAYGVFTGSSTETGDYTTRAAWSSDDPSVVFVGDGLSLSPDGTVYAAGQIVGIKPGVATIRAAYLDFSASMTVDVQPLENARIEPLLTDIAENLQQQFELKAVVSEGEAEQDISTSAVWRIGTTTAQASVDSGTGLVHANSAGDGAMLQLVARLPECGREYATSFRVSPIASLELSYELGEQAALPMGYSDSFALLAHFADPAAPAQNLSSQANVDNDYDEFVSVATGDERYYVTALTEDEGDATLSVKLDDGTQTRSFDTKIWRVVDLELEEITLSPEDLDVHYPDTGQFTVTGVFEDGLSMPVTRHVSWTVSDSTVAGVASDQDSAGEVTVTGIAADAEVEAAITLENEDVLDSQATVHAYPYTSDDE